jgi:hypothetical protein
MFFYEKYTVCSIIKRIPEQYFCMNADKNIVRRIFMFLSRVSEIKSLAELQS